MGQMKKLGAVAPLKKRSYKERIAASSAKLAEIWQEFEDSERVLEAFSRSQGYTCPIGPFEGALPPLPAPGTPAVDVEASLSELETAVAEAQRAYKHISQRLELVCRSYGLPSPFGPPPGLSFLPGGNWQWAPTIAVMSFCHCTHVY